MDETKVVANPIVTGQTIERSSIAIVSSRSFSIFSNIFVIGCQRRSSTAFYWLSCTWRQVISCYVLFRMLLLLSCIHCFVFDLQLSWMLWLLLQLYVLLLSMANWLRLIWESQLFHRTLLLWLCGKANLQNVLAIFVFWCKKRGSTVMLFTRHGSRSGHSLRITVSHGVGLLPPKWMLPHCGESERASGWS